MKKFQTISVPKIARIEAMPLSSRFILKAIRSLESIQIAKAELDEFKICGNIDPLDSAEHRLSSIEDFLQAIVDGFEDECEEDEKKDEGKNLDLHGELSIVETVRNNRRQWEVFHHSLW